MTTLVSRGWRRLTQMRTAIVLLLLLGVAAIPGSLLPQRGADLARVDAYLLQHKTSGPVFDRLYLFDVYAAPWFAAIYLLLTISLVGCLVPRIRHHARVIREAPPAVSARTRADHRFTTATAPAEVLARATGRTRRWRRTVTPGSVTADRSRLRESANLAFHVALLVVLVGIAVGSVRGFEADKVLVEADGLGAGLQSASFLTNVANQYDAVRPGRLIGQSELRPWTLQLTDFTTTYQDGTTTPKDYDAKVRWRPGPGKAWRTSTVKVNDPLDIDGDKVYLLNHGYAPVFRLRAASGAVVAEAPVVCPVLAPMTGLARCTFKAPQAGLGFRMTFAPTGILDPARGVVSADPRLNNPDVLVEAWSGDLGLSRAAQSVYALDTTLMTKVATDNLVLRDPARAELHGLPGGLTLDVAGVQEWASVRVKRDPGKRVVLLGAAVGVLAVLGSLGLRRRRVWVRTSQVGPRTLVEVGATPRTERDREAAERDAARLAAALRSDLDGQEQHP